MQDKSQMPTPARNVRNNLRRIFAAAPPGYQAETARKAKLTTGHLTRIVGTGHVNPTIGTIESLAKALEIPVEVLLSARPPKRQLKIL